jgi:hypothetical protein
MPDRTSAADPTEQLRHTRKPVERVRREMVIDVSDEGTGAVRVG